jgi:hypothetical protein
MNTRRVRQLLAHGEPQVPGSVSARALQAEQPVQHFRLTAMLQVGGDVAQPVAAVEVAGVRLRQPLQAGV